MIIIIQNIFNDTISPAENIRTPTTVGVFMYKQKDM